MATFARWVDFDTIQSLAFNYWEPSMYIDNNGEICTVYHSQPRRQFNIVVIDRPVTRSDGVRHEFYFRTFEGKHSGQCRDDEEAQPFYDALRDTVRRKHRVAGKNLESKMRETIPLLDNYPQDFGD